MKKIFVLIMFALLAFPMFADIHTDDAWDSSYDSLVVSEASLYVLFSVSLSGESSEASEDDEWAIRERYERFEKLVAQKDLKAKDVFSQEGLAHFGLTEEDRIVLDKTKVGILVSDADRALVLVPSELKYSNVNTRAVR